MRGTAGCSALFLTSGVLVACGSARGSAESTAAAQITTTWNRARARALTHVQRDRPLTKRQAVAFARAVNLRATDVPGFKASKKHEHETAAEKRLDDEFRRCAGVGDRNRQVAEVSSNEYEREDNAGARSVESEVIVWRTRRLAARDLAALRSRRGRQCASHYFDSQFKGLIPGARVSPVRISSASPPAPGTTGSFGWRITVTITAPHLRLPVYTDALGFAYGPAAIMLVSFGAPMPVPAATQQRLFALLLKRAKLHSV
jgi:hypothetical protein